MRYLTRLFAFNDDEFIIIYALRYVNTSYSAIAFAWTKNLNCDRRFCSAIAFPILFLENAII